MFTYTNIVKYTQLTKTINKQKETLKSITNRRQLKWISLFNKSPFTFSFQQLKGVDSGASGGGSNVLVGVMSYTQTIG